ncbi:putative membrane protein YdjX (TVP38/TMEM64 family) [Oxalobacteraceae bacterium GrIS 2.11]
MSKYKRLILVILFLLLLLLISELTGLRDHFSLKLVHDKLANNLVTGILIFIALFVIGNLIHIPGLLFLAAAVLALGRVNGGIATYIAATISCAVTFLIIQYLGGAALRQINNKIAIKLLDHLDARPVRNIVLLRTLFQTLPALNYTLALSGVSFRSYMIGTILGLPLPLALYCLFFSQLAKSFSLG